MPHPQREYLPAAGSDWFLPLYDPLTRLVGFKAAREALIDRADLRATRRVLDIGCGTGTLAVLIKQRYPSVEVIGLDPDPKALARAERKARRASATIQFDQGFADALPYPDAWFDRVFSSMMFHHVPAGDRPKMLREVHRVLAPGGRFELLDFEGPQGEAGLIARLVHSHHQLKDNDAEHIRALLREAGLAVNETIDHRLFLLGRLAYFTARR